MYSGSSEAKSAVLRLEMCTWLQWAEFTMPARLVTTWVCVSAI